MKASVACLLFASLLVIVFPRGNEGHKRNHAEKEAMRRKNFKEYDADGDGFIDIEELRNKRTGQKRMEDIQDIMENIDADGNKKICYAEFRSSFLTNAD